MILESITVTDSVYTGLLSVSIDLGGRRGEKSPKRAEVSHQKMCLNLFPELLESSNTLTNV